MTLSTSERRVRATIYPDGPILLRGDFEIIDVDGTPIPTRRRVVALCRCGRSALAPLCDGTHKAVWPPGGRRSASSGRRVVDRNGAEPA
jgi:CDGSH-type Zn-finger protein